MHAGCEGGKRTLPMASNGVRRKSISPAGLDAGIASGLVPAMRTVWSKARVLTATPLQGRLWSLMAGRQVDKERVLVGTHTYAGGGCMLVCALWGVGVDPAVDRCDVQRSGE